jgi:hypothetical protein
MTGNDLIILDKTLEQKHQEVAPSLLGKTLARALVLWDLENATDLLSRH